MTARPPVTSVLRLGTLLGLAAAATGCDSNPTAPLHGPSLASGSPPAGAIVVPQGDPLTTVEGVTINHGGYGSALAVDPSDPTLFYSLTDRGPNVTIACGDQSVLAYPVPHFSPEIGKFRLAGSTLSLVGTITLKKPSGQGLSGLPQPNAEPARTEAPGRLDCSPLTPDPDGIDSEGLAIAKDGSFWVSDEYGPDVVHFQSDGTMYQGERLRPGSGLPKVLARRRSNRGMEGLTMAPDGKTLVGIMQSPLDNPTAGGSSAGRTSRVARIVVIDTRTGATRQYAYILDAAANLNSEVAALTQTLFLVDERNGTLPGAGNAIKKVYSVDISEATDISDPTDGVGGLLFDGKTLEELTAGVSDAKATLLAKGVVAAAKSPAPVVDLLQAIPGYPHDKVEGLTILDNRTIAISNDDDFGVTDDGSGHFIAKTLPLTGGVDFNSIYILRLATPLRP
jgi:Esterase-like activity of phytase